MKNRLANEQLSGNYETLLQGNVSCEMTGAAPFQFERKASYEAARRPLAVESSAKWLSPFAEMLRLRYWTFRRVWAVICIGLFLALQLIAESGPLHKWIHPDADSPNHHCAITLLLNGQVNALDIIPILTAFIPTFLFILPQLQPASFAASDYRSSQSRAPPLLRFSFL